jgi:hypothetical protein
MYQSKFEEIWQDERAALSPADSYRLEFLEPPQMLAPFITTFFIYRSSEEWVRDCQPANTGHMMIFLSGQGQARFANGNVNSSQPISLIGPTNAAMQYVVRGPLTCFGCAFTPVGWRAITNMSASDSCDMFVDSSPILGPESSNVYQQLRALEKASSANAAPDEHNRQMLDIICSFLIPRLNNVPDRHRIYTPLCRWHGGRRSVSSVNILVARPSN